LQISYFNLKYASGALKKLDILMGLRHISLIICLKHTIFTAEKYFYGIAF